MVNINLLPEKVRAAEVLKIIVALGTLSLILPMLFWAYRFTGAQSELASVEKQIDSVNLELNSPHLKQVVEEVEQFGRDKADLEAKSSVVNLIRKKQVPLVRFLDVLPDLVPKRAFITRLEILDDKGAKKAMIEGTAFSPEVVADFYANMEANAAISKPAMESAPVQTLIRGKSAFTFKLSCQIEDAL